jgi:thiamine-phosphate pyrophosphorylase
MATSRHDFWNGIPSSKIYPLLSPDRLGRVGRLASLGVARIQVRDKGDGWGSHWDGVKAALDICRGAGIPLVINDRADIALALGAEGLHVGQDDLSPLLARRLLGPGVEIGLSCATREEAERALADPDVDLLSIGPVFATPVKPEAPAVGPDLVRACAGRGKPLAAIGGIDASNARRVLEAGADLLAMVRAVEDWLE